MKMKSVEHEMNPELKACPSREHTETSTCSCLFIARDRTVRGLGFWGRETRSLQGGGHGMVKDGRPFAASLLQKVVGALGPTVVPKKQTRSVKPGEELSHLNFKP